MKKQHIINISGFEGGFRLLQSSESRWTNLQCVWYEGRVGDRTLVFMMNQNKAKYTKCAFVGAGCASLCFDGIARMLVSCAGNTRRGIFLYYITSMLAGLNSIWSWWTGKSAMDCHSGYKRRKTGLEQCPVVCIRLLEGVASLHTTFFFHRP